MSRKAVLQAPLDIRVFDPYLTVWVVLCMVIGVRIGRFLPAIPAFLGTFEYAKVSIPMAGLIWLMIWPLMLGLVTIANRPAGWLPAGRRQA